MIRRYLQSLNQIGQQEGTKNIEEKSGRKRTKKYSCKIFENSRKEKKRTRGNDEWKMYAKFEYIFGR